MKTFFGGSKKSSSKKHHQPSDSTGFDDPEDPQHATRSEPSSPQKSSRSPKKPSRPASFIESPSKHPRSSRASRHSTDPGHISSSSRRKKHDSSKIDPNTHPLNLPPEERNRRFSALSQSVTMSARDSMDIDQEPPANSGSSTPPQAASAQANFAVQFPMGRHTTKGMLLLPLHHTSPIPQVHSRHRQMRLSRTKLRATASLRRRTMARPLSSTAKVKLSSVLSSESSGAN